MIESTSTTVRADPLAGLWIRLVAFCLGAGGCLYLIGMIGLYHAILDPLPRTASLAIAAALLAAAVGSWLPQRAMAWASRSGRRSGEALASAIPSDVLPHTITPAQRGLLWVVLAVAALAAGTLGLILLWATGPVEDAHRWVAERFFLSPVELLAADFAAIAVTLIPPWLAMGLAIACLYSLTAGYELPGRTGGGLAGAMLIGAGLAMAAGTSEVLQASPGRTALVGTLPIFVAAVLAVGRAGKRQPVDLDPQSGDAQLPEWAPEAGYALLGTLVAWGAVVGTMLSVWPRVIATGLKLLPVVEGRAQGWLALMVGLGVVVGGLLARRHGRPAAGCGLAMVLAGIATGGTIAGCALAGTLGQKHTTDSLGMTTGLVLSALSIGGLAVGGAYPYLRRALIVQSGSPSVARAQVMTAALTGVVMGAVAAPCWIVPEAGTLVALASASLVALATGGLLVIFDVGGTPNGRRWRLATVFVGLMGLLIGLPTVSRQWLRWDRNIAALREGPWLTASLTRRAEVVIEPGAARLLPTPTATSATRRGLRAVMQLCGTPDRCWLISSGELAIDRLIANDRQRIEAVCYDPLGATLFDGVRPDGRAPTLPIRSPVPALRALRWVRTRYDLIVIAPVPGSHLANAAIWSAESLNRAVRRIAPRGVLAGLIPPAAFGRVELATFVATFAACAPSNAHAGLVGQGADQVLVLLASGDPARGQWQWDHAARAGMHRVGPVSSFLKVAPGVLPNSLRAPAPGLNVSGEKGGLELARYVSETAAWRRLGLGDAPMPVWPPQPSPATGSGDPSEKPVTGRPILTLPPKTR